MSKNLTRKGLALGAIVALGTTLFAGAPAFAGVASAKIVTTPSAGTTYNTIAGATFDLSTLVDQSLVSADGKSISKLAYAVGNASAKPITIDLAGATASGTANTAFGDVQYKSGDSVDSTAAVASYASVTAVSGSDKSFAVKVNVASQSNDTVDKGTNVIRIGSTTDTTDAFSVTVQAFIDENGNGRIDALDYVGELRTINFIPVASAVVATSIKSAVLGTTTIKAKVVIGGDVNMQSLGNQVSVGFFENGAVRKLVGATSTTSIDTTDASYDADEAGLLNGNKFTLANTTAAAGNNKVIVASYTAQAYIGTGIKLGAVSGTVTNANGTAVSVDSTDILKTTNSANTILSKDTTDYSTIKTAGSTSTTKVRTGFTGAITFTSQLKSADSSDVSDSGQTVKVTLSKGATFDSASTFTAGGAVLTATSGAVSFTTTSSSTGGITFTGASNSGKKGDVVNVDIQVLTTAGYRPSATATNRNVLTWGDATVANPVLTTGVRGNDANSTLHIAKGASYTLDYAVVDNFGQPWTSTSSYRLEITTTTGTGAAFTYYPAVVAGKASQVVVDNSTTTGNYTVSAALKKLTGTTWANDTTGTTSADVVVYVDAKVAATVSATVPTDAVATTAKTLVNADLRADSNTNSAAAIGYGSTVTASVSGTVADSTGAAVAGQSVTIAGTGLGFVSKSGLVYAVGSITVQTDANGAYNVSVFSATAGKATVTVTAGAATASKTITFSGVTVQASTNVLTIDAPALSQVGRAVTVTVKIVDKFGNAVSGITPVVSVTGVGSITTAAATDKTGLATVQFLAGANDFGDAVITAKYTASDDVVVSATKTVTVGVTDAQVDIVKNRVTAVASFTKGRTVAFYVDGIKKWSKLSASDADVVLNYNLKKGTHTVTVKISGGFVTTERYIVK